MQVVILAGGLATRLGTLTKQLPKSLLPIAGKPFIDYQLELLAKAGVTEVVLCIGYLGEQIKQRLGDGSRYRLSITYSRDGLKALGTGGALQQAVLQLQDEFFVMYGDSYLTCDYQGIWDYFRKQSALGLMTAYHNHNRYGRSNLKLEGEKVVVYDKNSQRQDLTYIDYGLSIFRKTALALAPQAVSFDLSELHQQLIEKGQLLGHRVATRFYEVGSLNGLREFTQMVKASTI